MSSSVNQTDVDQVQPDEDRRGMDGKPCPRRTRCTEKLEERYRCWGLIGHGGDHWTFVGGFCESWIGE